MNMNSTKYSSSVNQGTADQTLQMSNNTSKPHLISMIETNFNNNTNMNLINNNNNNTTTNTFYNLDSQDTGYQTNSGVNGSNSCNSSSAIQLFNQMDTTNNTNNISKKAERPTSLFLTKIKDPNAVFSIDSTASLLNTTSTPMSVCDEENPNAHGNKNLNNNEFRTRRAVYTRNRSRKDLQNKSYSPSKFKSMQSENQVLHNHNATTSKNSLSLNSLQNIIPVESSTPEKLKKAASKTKFLKINMNILNNNNNNNIENNQHSNKQTLSVLISQTSNDLNDYDDGFVNPNNSKNKKDFKEQGIHNNSSLNNTDIVNMSIGNNSSFNTHANNENSKSSKQVPEKADSMLISNENLILFHEQKEILVNKFHINSSYIDDSLLKNNQLTASKTNLNLDYIENIASSVLELLLCSHNDFLWTIKNMVSKCFLIHKRAPNFKLNFKKKFPLTLTYCLIIILLF